MKNVYVMTNFNIAAKAELASRVTDILLSEDMRVFVPSFACGILKKEGLNGVQGQRLPDGTDLVVVIGGDGTILDAGHRTADRGIPILSVNMGRVGYMAELEPDEIELIRKVVVGEYRIEKRSMLKVEAYDGDRVIFSGRVLNDAVVAHGNPTKMADLELISDGVSVGSYRADGLIVSTPTGSTAYSLSCGGPILDPHLRGICVTPICAHTLNSRSMIFPDESVIEIRNSGTRLPFVCLSVDGKMNIHITPNNFVRIRRSSKHVNLVRVKNSGNYTDFYKKLKTM